MKAGFKTWIANEFSLPSSQLLGCPSTTTETAFFGKKKKCCKKYKKKKGKYCKSCPVV
jgi:hypothetical protein